MITLTELKEIQKEINILRKSAKNVVKLRKALAIAEKALERQNAFTATLTTSEHWDKLDEQLGDSSIVHDIADDLEDVIDSIEYDIFTSNYTTQDYIFASLCARNID